MYQREIQCDWTPVEGPSQEPITLDEAKLHAGNVQDDENLLFLGYLKAARSACENFMNRALFTQTWKLQLSGFADIIWLPRAAPLQNDPDASPSTAPVVQYYDVDGVLQTLASSYYIVDTVSEPGRIVRAPNQSWPAVQSDRLVGAVVITYVAGWDDVEDIPEDIKQGIRLFVAYQDADRIGSPDADASRRAAEALWTQAGPVYWREPQCRS